MKDDELSWRRFKRDCSNIEGLSKSEITEFMETCDKLLQLFGNEILSYEYFHPIGELAFNRVVWTRRRLIWLRKQLKESENCLGYGSLLSSLSFADRYDDSITSLRIAESMRSTCDSIEFERDIHIGIKQTDMKVRIDGYDIYIEHSTSEKSEKEKVCTGAIIDWAISISKLNKSNLSYTGRVTSSLDHSDQQKALGCIQKVMMEADKTGYSQVEENSLIEFAACTESKNELLQKWSDECSRRSKFPARPVIVSSLLAGVMFPKTTPVFQSII